MKSIWTKEEEYRLIELKNKDHTIPEIADILKRSNKSIESKIFSLKQNGLI